MTSKPHHTGDTIAGMQERPSLLRFAWLSIGAAVLTIGVKTAGYLITGSVGLLSDALESVVNLVAALTAFAALRIGAQPPDEEHAYGHQKVEYLSSGAEGGLIAVAAAWIAVSAIERLINPRPISDLSLGLALSGFASLVNLAVAQVLLRVGRRERSIALEADGLHLMTDVWTSVGVLLGVAAVALTGWAPLDAIVALAAAGWIGFNGYRLVRRSALGLIDTAIPAAELAAAQAVLDAIKEDGVGTTRCARAWPAHVRSSPCTCCCRAAGASSAGMTWPSRSSVRSAPPSPRRPFSPTSNRPKTRSASATRGWIANDSRFKFDTGNLRSLLTTTLGVVRRGHRIRPGCP